MAIIHEAIKKSSYYRRCRPPKAKWWNETLNNLRNDVIKKWREKKRINSKKNHDDFIKARNVYKNAIKKAKKVQWKQFVENLDDPQKMAYFNKVVLKGCQERVGLLKKDDGAFTSDLEESINLLLAEHFPGSVPLSGPIKSHQGYAPNYTKKVIKADDLNDSYITMDMVKKAINSFDSLKAAGPDDLQPIALQTFIRNKHALKRLTSLFRAVIKLGYSPKQWNISHVIFIPKMGRLDYTLVRAF